MKFNTALLKAYLLALSGIAALALPFAVTAQEVSSFDRQVRKHVEENFGPILTRAEAPALHALLLDPMGLSRSIIDRLSSAQQALKSNHSVIVGDMILVDSVVPVAKVLTENRRGSDLVVQKVVVTKGFLKEMFLWKGSVSSLSQDDFLKGLVRVVGVLCHEFAHTLDLVDTQSIESTFGRGRSKEIEIKADVNGSLICEKAGFPVFALSEALKYMLPVYEKPRTELEAMSDSHPPLDIRENVLDPFMTARRYEKGIAESSLPVPHAVMAAAALELDDQWSMIRQVMAKQLPQDLALSMQLMIDGMASLDGKKITWLQILEFNRIYAHLLTLIAEKNSFEYLDLLIDFEKRKKLGGDLLGKLAKEGNLMNDADFDQLVMRFNIPAGTVLPSPRRVLRELPFYSRPEVRERVKSYIALHHQPTHSHMKERWNDIFAVTPASALSTAEYVKSYMRSIAKDGFTLQKWQGAPDGAVTEFFRVALRNQSPRARAAVLFDGGEFWPFLPRVVDNPARFPDFRSVEYRRVSAAAQYFSNYRRLKAQGGQELSDYTAYIALLWEMRGALALAEYFDDKLRIDWAHISEVLGKNRHAAEAEVRRAFEQVISGQNPEITSGVDDVLSARGSRRPLPLHISSDAVYPLPRWCEGRSFAAEVRAFVMNLKNNRENILAVPISHQSRQNLRDYSAVTAVKVQEIKPGRVIDYALIAGVHRATVNTLLPGLQAVWKDVLAFQQMRAVMESNLTVAQKREWLRLLFLTDAPGTQDFKYQVSILGTDSTGEGLFPVSWQDVFFYFDGERLGEVLHNLQVTGAIGPIEDFVIQLRDSRILGPSTTNVEKVLQNMKYAMFLNAAAPSLLHRLEAQFRPGVSPDKVFLTKLFKIISAPNVTGKRNYSSGGNALTRELIRNVGRWQSMMRLTDKQVFELVTGEGPSLESDEFFTARLAAGATPRTLREWLRERRIFQDSLVVSLAQKALAESAEKIARENSNLLEINNFFDAIEQLAPDRSAERDAWIEKLAWKFGLTGNNLKVFVEERKSGNVFNPASMGLADQASAVVSTFRHLSVKTRWRLLSYLMRPSAANNAVLTDIERELMRSEALSDLKELDTFFASQTGDGSKKAKAEIIRFAVSHVERLALELKGASRVMLIQSVLNSGKGRLSAEADFYERVIQGELRLKRHSKEDRGLRALLRVIPRHEIVPTLAYALAVSRDTKTDSALVFKVFRTVGIKLGQITGLFNVFGPEVSRDSRLLKDDAGAMSKALIENVLKKQYPDLAREIVLEQVLGSASVKTVVLVRLRDGSKAVLLVRHPDIISQIRTNLDLGKRLIQELEREGVFEGSALFNLLLKGLEAQLDREIDFRNEAKNLEKLRPLVDRLNRDLEGELKGWKMDSVLPHRDFAAKEDVALLTFANGAVSVKNLPAGVREEIGPILVRASLRLFFDFGAIEPDRHEGNWLVDPVKKKIFWIDAGQLEQFSVKGAFSIDDRLQAAFLLQALLGNKNAAEAVKAALAMAGSHALPPDTKAALEGAIAKILRQEQDTMVIFQLFFAALADHHVDISPKFSFGLFKGLMVLSGEDYVSAEKFREIISAEIRRLYLRKAGRPEVLRRMCEQYLFPRLGR